ncbi:hypothetical protein [Curtobacterium ammoniigenes]|uniref:hypothetical protein n=1 Tax=Curtobacterium ammoniigenes TaxID=395387 RepID=UPI000832C716|nr:hypothetical protein [Curtobacterium ammoniigenes]
MTEHTEASLSSLFAEVGLDPAQPDALLQSLADIADLGAGDPPVPNAELAALLAGSSAQATVHVLPSRRSVRASEAAAAAQRRSARSRRGVAAVTAVSLAGFLVAGTAAAAAADPQFRHAATSTIVGAVGRLTGHPQPAPPGRPAPGQHPVVSPVTPGSTALPPAPVAPTPEAPSSAPSSASSSAHGSSAPGGSASGHGAPVIGVPVPTLPTPGWLLGHGRNSPEPTTTPSPVIPTHPVIPPVLHTPPAVSHAGGQ